MLQTAINAAINSPLIGLLILAIMVVFLMLGFLALIRMIIVIFSSENKELIKTFQETSRLFREQLDQQKELNALEAERITMRSLIAQNDHEEMLKLIASTTATQENSNRNTEKIIREVASTVWNHSDAKILLAHISESK